jgi:DNA-binding CsgD family transcriptional regulator
MRAVIEIPFARGSLRELSVELTAAERQIVELIIAGCSNARVAELRGTSVRTVVNQVSAIFRRLRVGSRRELVAAIAAIAGSSSALTGASTLTKRELQVARYAALGHSNKSIAYELGLSPSTVGVLLARARKKLAGGELPGTMSFKQDICPVRD